MAVAIDTHVREPGQVSASRPRRMTGVMAWLGANLFSSLGNTLLTVAGIVFIFATIPPLIRWALIDAVWTGENRDVCNVPGAGACWAYVNAKFELFMYGRYPIDERWRVNLVGALLVIGLIPMAIPRIPYKRENAIYLLVVFPLLAYVLLVGGFPGLPFVDTTLWGGLLITLVVAIVGIVASVPLGVVLALGRRSKLPVVRFICVGFIEFIRGVPLITVLFMASVMLPIFLPPGVTFDKLLRALVGVSLFTSAYMAEVIRGGLQAVPRGQYEAAAALGLGYWRSMTSIILPQALKIVIPGIVNSFISHFKDTSLVLIIGIYDLLGIIQLGFADPNWVAPSIPATGYAFAAIVFWIFCFTMSRYSQFIERRLHAGQRR